MECTHTDTVTDLERGEVICSACGEVIAHSVSDQTCPDQHYTSEQYAERAQNGPSPSLAMYDKGLSTVIGSNRDSAGNMLPAESKHDFIRLRRWDSRSKSRSTASLVKAFVLLSSMKTKLNIPDHVVERAAIIYRKAVSAKLTRGRTISSILTASLYIACRESGTPRTLLELSTAANIDKKILYRDLATIAKKFNIQLEQYDISSFVVKISNNLKLTERTKRIALDILLYMQENILTAGSRPMALAAGLVYTASLLTGENLTLDTFVRHTGISGVTLRKIRRATGRLRDMPDSPLGERVSIPVAKK